MGKLNHTQQCSKSLQIHALFVAYKHPGALMDTHTKKPSQPYLARPDQCTNNRLATAAADEAIFLEIIIDCVVAVKHHLHLSHETATTTTCLAHGAPVQTAA